MYKKATFLLIVFLIILLYLPCFVCADVSDYLILQDIGRYKFITQTPEFHGKTTTIPGYVVGNVPWFLQDAHHFNLETEDITYEIDYSNIVEVQVTQHAGGDSDKWLLHNLGNRLSYKSGCYIRNIDGNNIFYSGENYLNGSTKIYRWLHNNVTINITLYPAFKNPEPIEVVKAYLHKFPSTIPSTLVLDRAYEENWNKDEMERNLWLCDKWFSKLGEVELDKVVYEVVFSMNSFLILREISFGISGVKEEKIIWEYRKNQDISALKNKVIEYRNWFNANREKNIRLITDFNPAIIYSFFMENNFILMRVFPVLLFIYIAITIALNLLNQKMQIRFSRTTINVLIMSSIIFGFILDASGFREYFSENGSLLFFEIIDYTLTIPLSIFLLIVFIHFVLKNKNMIIPSSILCGALCMVITFLLMISKSGYGTGSEFYIFGYFLFFSVGVPVASISGLIYGLFMRYRIDKGNLPREQGFIKGTLYILITSTILFLFFVGVLACMTLYEYFSIFLDVLL